MDVNFDTNEVGISDPKPTLKIRSNSNTFLELLELQNSGLYTDLRVQCKDGFFDIHSVVLLNLSPTFLWERQQLDISNSGRDEDDGPPKLLPMELTQFSIQDVGSVLFLFYTGGFVFSTSGSGLDTFQTRKETILKILKYFGAPPSPDLSFGVPVQPPGDGCSRQGYQGINHSLRFGVTFETSFPFSICPEQYYFLSMIDEGADAGTSAGSNGPSAATTPSSTSPENGHDLASSITNMTAASVVPSSSLSSARPHEVFKCRSCDERILDEPTFFTHLEEDHSMKMEHFRCPVKECPRFFVTLQGVVDHCANIHLATQPQQHVPLSSTVVPRGERALFSPAPDHRLPINITPVSGPSNSGRCHHILTPTTPATTVDDEVAV